MLIHDSVVVCTQKNVGKETMSFRILHFIYVSFTVLLTLFQAASGERSLFGQPLTLIKHNFFLVIAMKLKFFIASQLLIRKLLSKYLCAIMEL